MKFERKCERSSLTAACGKNCVQKLENKFTNVKKSLIYLLEMITSAWSKLVNNNLNYSIFEKDDDFTGYTQINEYID